MSEEVKMRLQPLLEDEQADVLQVKPQLPRRRRRGRIIALVIVLLVILIASGVIFYMRRANQPVVRFTQAAVTTGNITVQVSATGPVTPNAEYDMNFLTTGQVKAIDVQVGQQVKKGDIVSLSKGEVRAGQKGGRGRPPTKSLWSSMYGGGELANT